MLTQDEPPERPVMPLHWAWLDCDFCHLGLGWKWGAHSDSPDPPSPFPIPLDGKTPTLGVVGCFVETSTRSSPNSNLGNHLILGPLLCRQTPAGAVAHPGQTARDWYLALPAPCPPPAQPTLRRVSGCLCWCSQGGGCDVTEMCDSGGAGSPRSVCVAEGGKVTPVCADT